MNWDAAWLIWVVLALGSFGILEWRGIKTKGMKGSLSYQVWRILFSDTDDMNLKEGRFPKKPRPVVYFLVAGAFLWLFQHFLLGGRLG